MSKKVDTKKNIEEHIKNVQIKILHFCSILMERGSLHDKSKLEEAELEGFIEMDKESHFVYNSPEYLEKKERFKDIFEHHYKKNRHHPEHWEHEVFPFCPDLVDLIEFLCDNISYKENLSYCEAVSLIEIQAERYGFPENIKELLKNTLINYYVKLGNYYNPEVAEEFNFLKSIWELKI